LLFLSERGLQVVGGIPAQRSLAESLQFRSRVGEDTAAAYLFSLHRVRGVHPLFTRSWLALTYGWLLDALGEVLNGEDPSRALADAQRRAEAYVACVYRRQGFTDTEAQMTCAREVDPDFGWVGDGG